MSKDKNRRFDIQDRLIDFAVRVIRVAEKLPNTKIGNHVRGQILRSGTAPAPNYGEAQAVESRADFVHKPKIALKELRETNVWLLIIARAELIKPRSKLEPILEENEELISILFKSIQTAKEHDNAVNN